MTAPRVPVVSLLAKRTLATLKDYDAELSPTERVLSSNAVTGWSVNVPIASTCHPSKVCASSCYAASNLMAATDALRRQWRVLLAMRRDPVAFARRVCAEYDALGLTFVRWNGVGDLDEAAVAAINWICDERPDVTLWVVTRIPEMAAKINFAQRVFVHFSLDASSIDRKARFEALKPTCQYFFSYQCEKGGWYNDATAREVGASVVFAHRYKMPPGASSGGNELCPLNGADDLSGMCARCRRCFNGDAVRMRGTL